MASSSRLRRLSLFATPSVVFGGLGFLGFYKCCRLDRQCAILEVPASLELSPHIQLSDCLF